MHFKITSSNPLPNLEPAKIELTSKAVAAPVRPNVEAVEANSTNTKQWELSNVSNHIKNKALSATSVNTVAWPSKLMYSVHQESVARALGSRLPASEVKLLQNAVKEADQAQYQTLEMSYRHAMTPIGMSKQQARSMSNNFVTSELQEAKRFQAAGNRNEALRHLGFAMHVMQDATSPAHQGFAVYHGDDHAAAKVKLAGHVVEELFDPGKGSKLDAATEKAYKYFTGELPMPKDFFANLGFDKR
jgi:hypothetical protein